MEKCNNELKDIRFRYSVKYSGHVYPYDFVSSIREQLQPEIAKFQRALGRLHWLGWLTPSHSTLLNGLNPFHYISMGTVLNLTDLSGDFRYKILKPMLVNFLMATKVFEIPVSLLARYLEFFDIESFTPMQTWDRDTRSIYEDFSTHFRDKIYLKRPVRKVYCQSSHAVDEDDVKETFDEVIFACNANQTPMILNRPTFLERHILSSKRYESELHNHTVAHSDSSVIPDNEVKPFETRSNYIEQYGVRPDNY